MEELLSKLIRNDIHLNLVKDELTIRFPKSGITPGLLDEIKTQKEEIIAYLKSLNEQKYDRIPKAPLQKSYPLSSSQKRLWILSQFQEENTAYNLQGQMELNGNSDFPHFLKAVKTVVERHESLRTYFKREENGEIHQWIMDLESIEYAVEEIDLSGLENSEKEARTLIRKFGRQAIELDQGPLWRLSLIKFNNNKFIFCITIHHILCDGWSMDILSKEILTHYKLFCEGKDVCFPSLKVQYKDYAVWQLGHLDKGSIEVHRNYWIDKLLGKLPVLNFQTLKKRPLIRTSNGHVLRSYLSKDLSNAFSDYCHSQKGSLFMGALASIKVFFYQLTGQEDIIIGTAVSGRSHIDLENQIGFFLNSLALRNKLNKRNCFNDIYLQIKDTVLDAFAHENYPFDCLVEELAIKKDKSRNPVFDVMLSIQNSIDLEDGTIVEPNRIYDCGEGVSKVDLEITFQQVGEFIAVNVIYNTDIYDPKFMEGFFANYKILLRSLLDKPTESIDGLIRQIFKMEARKRIGKKKKKSSQQLQNILDEVKKA